MTFHNKSFSDCLYFTVPNCAKVGEVFFIKFKNSIKYNHDENLVLKTEEQNHIFLPHTLETLISAH